MNIIVWWLSVLLRFSEPEDVEPPDALQQQLLFNAPRDYCRHEFMKRCPVPWESTTLPSWED